MSCAYLAFTARGEALARRLDVYKRQDRGRPGMSEEKAFCRTDDLAIGYGKTPLMEHIELGVGKGTILTLIGPNGAGKSTLLKTCLLYTSRCV